MTGHEIDRYRFLRVEADRCSIVLDHTGDYSEVLVEKKHTNQSFHGTPMPECFNSERHIISTGLRVASDLLKVTFGKVLSAIGSWRVCGVSHPPSQLAPY